MNKDSRIINLVSAAGWKAIYETQGRLTRLPLVAWALVELEQDTETHAITGLVLRNGVPIPANRQENFKGYEQPPEKSSSREHDERARVPASRGGDAPSPRPSSEEEGASLWFA